MKRILFIGQAPGRDGDDSSPLSGRSGRRFCKFMGLGFDSFLACPRRNVLGTFEGKKGKGDAFDPSEARNRARRLKLRAKNVMFGRHVATAFGVEAEFLSTFTLVGKKCLLLPHPSGISHWYNDAENVAKARQAFWRFAFE